MSEGTDSACEGDSVCDVAIFGTRAVIHHWGTTVLDVGRGIMSPANHHTSFPVQSRLQCEIASVSLVLLKQANNTFSVQHNRVLKLIPALAIAASTQNESEKRWLLNASTCQAKAISMVMTEINLSSLATVVVNCLVSPLHCCCGP